MQIVATQMVHTRALAELGGVGMVLDAVMSMNVSRKVTTVTNRQLV